MISLGISAKLILLLDLENILVVSKHVIEGISELISNLLDLDLLSVDLILDVVNPLVELGDVHLSVLEPALGHLVLVLDAQDFVLQLPLSPRPSPRTSPAASCSLRPTGALPRSPSTSSR